MRNYKRLICFCLAAVELFLFACCAKEEEPPAPERDFCRIDGEVLYFLADEELEALRAPLIKLLSNREERVYPDEGGYEEVAPDPSLPSIADCYYCGLFDVTGDGVPELLIHPWGYNGSSGAVDYFVYDIKTGSRIDEIPTGSGSICSYFDTERRAAAIGVNSLTQSGLSYQYTNLSIRIYNSAERAYVNDFYISADYALEIPPEYQNEAKFFVNGKAASWYDYYGLLDRFYVNYVRIPETELIMIDWDDVSSEDDDRFVRAERMADALLGSEQKFIIPNKDNVAKDFGEKLCLTRSN